jgi:hypothetical protein
MRRPSASLVVSVIALVFAVASTAVAGSYIITSTKQIKPSVRKALKGNRGPRGLTGQVGAPGPPGPVVVNRPTWVDNVGSAPPGGAVAITAQCPDGMGALTGSWSTTSGFATAERTDNASWTVAINNRDFAGTAIVRVSVSCAPHRQAIAAP